MTGVLYFLNIEYYFKNIKLFVNLIHNQHIMKKSLRIKLKVREAEEISFSIIINRSPRI